MKDFDSYQQLHKAYTDLQKEFEELQAVQTGGVLEMFFEYAPDAIVIADTQSGKILRVNRAAEKLFGRSAAELQSMHQTQLHPPETHDFSKQEFEQGKEKLGKTTRFPAVEHKIIRKNGQIVPVEIHASAIILNEKPALLGIFRDISLRKKAEEEKQETQLKYNLFSENINEAYALFSPKNNTDGEIENLKILECNKHFENQIEKDARNKSLCEIFPDQYDFWKKMYAQIREQGAKRFEVFAQKTDKHFDVQCFITRQEGFAAIFRDISQEKKYKELLYETQRVSKIGGWEFDVKTEKLTWTDLVFQIHEVAPDFEPDIDNALNFYPPESREIIRRAFFAALKKGRSYSLDLEMHTAKNNPVWVRTTGKAVFHAGKIIKLMGTFQDITEERENKLELSRKNKAIEKQNEQYKAINEQLHKINARIVSMSEKLKISEQRLDLAVKGSNNGFWDWKYENQQTIWWWSEKIFKFLGLNKSTDKPSFMLVRKLIHPKDLPAFISLLRQHLTRNRAFNIELRLLSANDQYRWYHIRGQALRSSGQRATRMSGFIADVNDQKNTEKTLRLNEKRLETLLQLTQMRDAPLQKLYDFTLDNAVKLTSSQIGFLGFYSAPRNRLKIQSWSKNVMKDCNIEDTDIEFDADNAGVWSEALKTKKPLIINDFSAPDPRKKGCPEGHTPLHSFMAIPLIVHDKPLALIAVANKEFDYNNTDIQQLSLLLDGMFRIVQQLRSEEALRKAKEKAEESDRLKSAFLANMSHEIRTPLNGIIGFSELLARPKLDPERRKRFAKVIKQSSDDLLQIINEILDISKIEAGLLRLNMQSYNLNHILDEIYGVFYHKAEQNDQLSFSRHKALADDKAYINTDPQKLKQVLQNLVGNALKFTKQGFVRFGYQIRNEDTLVFTVEDSGIGIPKSQQEMVFERFRQSDESAKRKYGGTGLGLSISKAIVQMLGGEIWLESELEKGTRISFVIPFEPAAPKKEPLHPVGKDYFWEGKTALVVEDDNLSALYLKEMLEETNIGVIHAKSAEECLKILKTGKNISVVLMDIRLPGMSGLEACRIIKKQTPEIPVIAQTAYTMEQDQQKSIEAGCDDYIAKPIKREILLSKIQHLIQK